MWKIVSGLQLGWVGGNKSAVPNKISPFRLEFPFPGSHSCPLTVLAWGFPWAEQNTLLLSCTSKCFSFLHLPSAIPSAISYSKPRFLSHHRRLLGKSCQKGSIHWAQPLFSYLVISPFHSFDLLAWQLAQGCVSCIMLVFWGQWIKHLA